MKCRITFHFSGDEETHKVYTECEGAANRLYLVLLNAHDLDYVQLEVKDGKKWRKVSRSGE